ncbi:MAG TPA: molybdenum cofactor guanylyltransferase [Gemmatimonadaceae bacterium]|nr:molybdenum cofactor guanylyltransferase [Gemmatimonadaceae bacterium]
MSPARPVTGVILAGGRASRYGGEAKGLRRVGGERIIDRVRAALEVACDDLLLIANDASSSDWLPGVRREGDVLPDLGSLGGIHAALSHAGTPVLVVAWDMPFVPAALLHALRSAGENGDADVVVPESDSRRGMEPLCAWYAPACLPAIERALERDDRRVVGFFGDVRVTRLDAGTVRRLGDPAFLFLNVNAPDDLALAEAHATTADGHGDRPQE